VNSSASGVQVELPRSGLLPRQAVEVGRNNQSSEQGGPCTSRIVTLPRRWPSVPVKPVMEMLRKDNIRKKPY